MLEKIQTLLANFEVDTALAFLQVHSERVGTVRNLAKSRNAASIRYEVELLLRNPRIYEGKTTPPPSPLPEGEGEPQAEAYATGEENPTPAPSPLPEGEGESYPNHYPEILVWKLKEARRLVLEKKRLSNSLHLHPKRNKKFEVEQILEMADQIGEIYKVKADFDRTNRLPVAWLAEASPKEMANIDRQEILQKIKNINSNISKKRAKLHNPIECAQGKPEKWRMEIKDLELERAKLKLLIGM